ncbi:MAG: dodecin domain-containing protein [Anaerolineaceae bacterium]|nr:dodecin domain-containing protein [Anaerolineaceae bacterium]
MSIARITEIKASSSASFDDAIKLGLARASKTLENMRSAWISSQEVLLNERGDITEYRVLMKVTFVLKN